MLLFKFNLDFSILITEIFHQTGVRVNGVFLHQGPTLDIIPLQILSIRIITTLQLLFQLIYHKGQHFRSIIARMIFNQEITLVY